MGHFRESRRFQLFRDGLLFSRFTACRERIPSTVLGKIYVMDTLCTILDTLLLVGFSFSIIHLHLRCHITCNSNNFDRLRDTVHVRNGTIRCVPVTVILVLFVRVGNTRA